MSLQNSAPLLVGAALVLPCAVLLALWFRRVGADTWEHTVSRHHRWSVHAPLALVALVAYVVTSSVLIALIVAGLAQWWLGSTQQLRPQAPQPSARRRIPGR